MMPYLKFNRHQWLKLKSSIPRMLTENEIASLKRINKSLSFQEIVEIYLPLSCLLNFYYSSSFRRQTTLKQFFGVNDSSKSTIPYIISITGSVAVGKSTTARILQMLLSRWPEHHRVELITIDGFLYSNKVLKEHNLMKKKGFPQSYDIHKLIKFIADLRSGVPNVIAPIYSHFIYDIIPGRFKNIVQPDILILEGLNAFQCTINYPYNLYHFFISDFVDFSIYIDAPEDLLKDWYINRFLKFREKACKNPYSYFYNYAFLTIREVINIASSLWNEINHVNLKENILPTRELAELILNKSENHVVDKIFLRKLWITEDDAYLIYE